MDRKPFGLVGGLRYTKLTKRLYLEISICVYFPFTRRKMNKIA